MVFQTTELNGIVKPIGWKAMPVTYEHGGLPYKPGEYEGCSVPWSGILRIAPPSSRGLFPGLRSPVALILGLLAIAAIPWFSLAFI